MESSSHLSPASLGTDTQVAVSNKLGTASRGTDTQVMVSNKLDVEASIIKAFVSELEFDSLHYEFTNQELEDFMRAEMESKNLACEQLERTLHLSASLMEVAYLDHSLAVKKNIALFNWYHIYVDDMAPKDPSTFIEFEQRFLSGQPQLDPVLDALVEVLMRMWDFYDPFCANSIVTSSFEFFSSTCMEPDLERLPIVQGTQRFSWYLRERTGLAAAFALMNFTKSSQINTMEYVQGVPDMTFWTCLSNDLFSFHKEELAGETANYVHTRAQIENKAPLQVLAEMTDDLRISRDAIYRVLSPSPDALRTWKVYERGYVAWHLAQDRYKLKDLGI